MVLVMGSACMAEPSPGLLLLKTKLSNLPGKWCSQESCQMGGKGVSVEPVGNAPMSLQQKPAQQWGLELRRSLL